MTSVSRRIGTFKSFQVILGLLISFSFGTNAAFDDGVRGNW